MSPRDLPARPHLDHLKNSAKALLKAVRAGDDAAVARLHNAIGKTPAPKLTDAQRAIAREYGFPTWAQLRAYVLAARSAEEAIDDFLAAISDQNATRARKALATHPGIATDSIHVAAALGRADAAAQLIARDPSVVSARAGNPPVDALYALCHSPFHDDAGARDGLLATARLLLDAGADPNTRAGRYDLPALHGVTGERSVLPIARLLLDAGANPTDGESVFHAAEHFHEDALDLLLSKGADLNAVGDWGNTPLYFLLRWWNVEREARVKEGMLWLLRHGADPNVPCAKERESALHVAAWRGQSAQVIRLLLEHGAHVNARRGDGRTAWSLARRAGYDAIAALLQEAGAEVEPLSPVDLLIAACGHGDANAARRLATPAVLAVLTPVDCYVLPEAADNGRLDVVAACIAAGIPVNATDTNGATALHYSAIRGRVKHVHALLNAGAATDIRDTQHSSTPLGWAFYGADFIADADGDYEGCVLALLQAGARPLTDEHQPAHEGVRKAMQAHFRS